jgi:ABC-type oligopeptide transport system ATPase subunit
MTAPLLEVSGLTVDFPGRRRTGPNRALDGVDLSIEPGETVGLVGESGSGKTTLGNVVLGLVRPTLGRVVFDGEDITHRSSARRIALSQRIQAVFQDPYSSFNPQRTVGQTVTETLVRSDVPRGERRARAVAMLERVGLPADAVDRFPGQFSGGQRQRIAIARALLPSPRLVVCDESVSALDLSVQSQVLNLLIDLQRDLGAAYLFITHDLNVLKHISRRVVVLQHGHLVEAGRTSEVMAHPAEQYTRDLLAASPVPDPDVQRARREAREAARAGSPG